jgi:hypothetical protein
MRVLKKELWPHRVELDLDQSQPKIVQVETWLGEHYGVYKGRWNQVNHWDHTAFYFRQGQDATMFALRWAS